MVNKLLWAVAISLVLANSLYYSIKLKFPQFRLIKIFKNLKVKTNNLNISPRDTLVMALSSKIGVGSLSGTALCIYYGGIGSIFWMFIISFFLTIISYIENALAIIYRNKERNKSGPPYYIEKGVRNKNLGILYAIIILISYIFFFSSIQNNTITTITYDLIGTNKVLISVFIALLSGVVFLKGITLISKICNKLFPFMMIIFLIVGLFVLCKELYNIPFLVKNILKEAFNFTSLSGGMIYTIIITFQRSVFASEAGIGTSAIVSGSTESENYKLQANLGIIQTYFIHFIILGITSLIIITADINSMKLINGIELTKEAFLYHLGSIGELILFIIILLFSFSTLIMVYYYGESSLSFITNNKKVISILKVLTTISIFIGGIIKATAIWKLIDISLALLTIINMYAIFKLRKKIISKLTEK